MRNGKFHIVLITPGQPSTNPRLLKEAILLADKGYKVTVLYSFWAKWADETDASIINQRKSITWKRVGGHPVASKWLYFVSKLLLRVYRITSSYIRAHNKYIVNRSSSALIKGAQNIAADLYIAHNLAALPAAAIAAKKNKSVYAFDAEDYHRGQWDVQSKESKLVTIIEDTYLRDVRYISVASPLIRKQYKEHYPKLDPVVINNVFSIENIRSPIKEYREGDILKLFWFSQTVGKGRGLEDVIVAMGKLKKYFLRFTILGDCSANEKSQLVSLAEENSVKNQVLFLQPVEEKDIFKIASSHHVGMALEAEDTINRDICLPNKIFTYLLSGIAIIATDTTAQALFLNAHPKVGKLFRKCDCDQLAEVIASMYEDPELLNTMRLNSLELAKNEFNWENEQNIFLNKIEEVLLFETGS